MPTPQANAPKHNKRTPAWKLSAYGHGAVLAGLLLLGIFSAVGKACTATKVEKPFQLIDVSAATQQATNTPPRPNTAAQKPTNPSTPLLKAPTVPVIETPTPPKPKPAPPKPKPAQPKPKPTPKPKKVSAAEFFKTQRAPAEFKQNKPAPKPTPQPARVTQPAAPAQPIFDTSGVRSALQAMTLTPLTTGSSNQVSQSALASYSAKLAAAINRAWQREGRTFTDETLRATLSFTVEGTGVLGSGNVSSASHSSTFNSAALRALRSVFPFSPPPGGKPVSFSIPFGLVR